VKSRNPREESPRTSSTRSGRSFLKETAIKGELPETDETQPGEGEQAETSGSELDQLRDEIAHKRPPEEEPA